MKVTSTWLIDEDKDGDHYVIMTEDRETDDYRDHCHPRWGTDGLLTTAQS